jgi:hypothetical protein
VRHRIFWAFGFLSVIGWFMASLDHAYADTFIVSVRSGDNTVVHGYVHWNKNDCSSRTGIVRVVSKPRHGKLIPSEEDGTIRRNRFKPDDLTCVGKPIKVFKVYYQSDTGFHGQDRFTIEATYSKRQVLDVYNVTVN